ncbi:MAG: entericidin A/B family lipoprotein [Burkholderiales bacterium]|nr:entericidin A/B family lipoprotein [Burkholderiales bacterium]
MRNINILLLVLLAALFSGGCNTLQGMGKDMKQGGEAIERAAKK